ncbi:YopX family protein [Bacillus thuringiensis]|uniref:YopX family protein n=1 Tax=Bacillus thuringiensis TaxID=1428 RepID=UPI0011A7F80A|nr:YopX family protein [Bacillus thuringiensis]
MREIKFRAWDVGSKQIYNWESIKLHVSERIDHDKVVVMQYTGLTEKNGKEMYKGDRIYISNGEREHLAEVTFDDGCFCVTGYLGDRRIYPLKDFLWRGYDIEVIENKFENPQLMEQFI